MLIIVHASLAYSMEQVEMGSTKQVSRTIAVKQYKKRRRTRAERWANNYVEKNPHLSGLIGGFKFESKFSAPIKKRYDSQILYMKQFRIKSKEQEQTVLTLSSEEAALKGYSLSRNDNELSTIGT